VLLLHRGFEVTDLEHFVARFVSGAAEQEECSDGKQENAYEG
jgi:hypothetical protein